jgi:hypothetical protein
MRMHGFAKFALASLALSALALLSPSADAQIDGAFIQQAAPERAAPARSEIPDYDSDYEAASRLQGSGGNTPEADARPGEYYFILAADAFRKKNYAFAIQMYQVSASWAYKPAAYNLGVMYARGQGVPLDLPRGLAWMALASERNEKHYVDAREAIYAEMSKEQFEQANVVWRELKPIYGDEVALRKAKARWAEVRANMTGSRVGSQALNLTVAMPPANAGTPSSPNFVAPGPKPSGKTEHNSGGHPGASTVAEIVGSQTVDGVTAYRQLRESDNPYDPKFDRTLLGTATVGQPTPAKNTGSKETTDEHTTDGTRHNG